MRPAVIMSIILPLLAGCAGVTQLSGDWNGARTAADGSDRDWHDAALTMLGKQTSIGIRNDSDFVYIVVKTFDQSAIAQVQRGGLVAWFDPKGGEEKVFGVRFPARGEHAFPPRGGGDNPPPPGGGMPAGLPDDGRPGPMGPTHFDLLSDGDEEGVRMSFHEARGILAGMDDRSGSLVIELQVPLRRSRIHPFAIEIADSALGIGLASGGRRTRTASDNAAGAGAGPGGGGDAPGGEGPGSGMGPGGGGMGPGGGGMGPGGGGMGGGIRGGGPDAIGSGPSIDEWLRVTLAKKRQQ